MVDMTPEQFQKAIAKLGLSQVAAGRFLEIGDRQIRKWIAGDARIPGAVAKLLRLMIRLKLSPAEVS
jgi:DNA-binding transcriptional regulator YiaG